MANQKGFSLLEALSVMAILSLITMISYPAIAGWKATVNLRTEIMTLRGNVMRAKLEAINNNVPVAVQLRNNGYMIFVDDGSGGGVRDDGVMQADERELVDHQITDEVSLSDNFPNSRFHFSGRVGTKPGTIKLVDQKGNEMKLIFNNSGRARIEKG